MKKLRSLFHRAAGRRVARDQKGFTLIEVIIVIALLTIAIGIMMNVFGNPFSENTAKAAAGKAADNLNAIAAAAQNYQVKHAAEATGLSGASTCLVEDGELTNVPTAPSPIGGTYTWDTTSYKDFLPDANANDTVVTLSTADLSTEVCQKVNEIYAGAAAGAAVPGAEDATKDLQCFGTSGAYIILKPIYRH